MSESPQSVKAAAREVPFGRPCITEADKRAVMDVLDGHILTHGPQCSAFESEFGAFMGAGAHCVSVSSCMAALHLAWLQLGIKPGDDVLLPAMTHTATAHAVEWVGARPVFVDCDPATGNVTAEGLEAAMTPQTRAIGLVHFAGIPCDMDAICALASRHGLKLVEDCALAVGARWRGIHVGLFGDAGCFSFYPVKHLTTGEGGMLSTSDPEIAAAVHKLRAFGVDRSHGARAIPGLYDVPSLGLNYRMSEMQAALGRSQLERAGEMLEHRRRNFSMIKTHLANIAGARVLDSVHPDAINSHYCLVLVLPDALASRREALIASLKAAGVGTSIYYPHPVPRLQYYRERYGDDPTRYTQAARISDQSIALPVGPHLSDDDAEYVGRTVADVVRQQV